MKHLVTVSEAEAGESSAEFRIGLRSAPYLADHAVQDMVVLPGSFFIEMARCVERVMSRGPSGRVLDVKFHRPITLAADDIVIGVQLRDLGDERTAYAFHEVGAGGEDDGVGRAAASLLIDRKPAGPVPGDGPAISVRAFQRATGATDADRFYGRLRANGNQYGPAFQRVESVWRAGDEALARLAVSLPSEAAEPTGLHPSLLDSMTQLLASFMLEQGRTFILRSIDALDVASLDLPDTLWAHAVLRREGGEDAGRFVGSVRAFDGSGNVYLELSGVAFTYLEHLDALSDADAESAARFVVAANFTAEPIEDSLQFWGAQFGVPIQPVFAPYNQVFQQLLDPGSELRANRDGVNVVLLSLEEWADRGRATGMVPSRDRADRCFRDRKRYTLPNGLEIVHLNSYETDYLYKEIFEDQAYLRHGIRLPDGATVLDIGANIGLFSLFVMSRCKDPSIYAFEPAPAAYEQLRANCEAHGSNARALNVGVGDKPGSATFTFYEQSSVFSGFHADATEDRAAIQTVVRNTLAQTTAADVEAVEQCVAELTAERLRATTHECRVTTVSDVVREYQIERIDLLKVDAEKSEWEVLAGVAEDDWPKIAQVVVEIHDRTGETVRRIEGLLVSKGFRCVVERERLLAGSGLYTLYATRSEADVEMEAPPTRRPGAGLQRSVEDLCAALREGIGQSAAPLVLCVCPRSPAAETDPDLKAALDTAEERLLAEAGALANVHAITSTWLRERYPVDDCHDPHGHQLGHIPYTAGGYAAIGTAVFRMATSLRSRRFKVIVLDCDNTLWKGVCGEDGPLALDVGGPYRALQEFMVGQMNAGMLLCLCSKNNERDVLDVFDQRPDMALKREHLVAWRVNWRSKSENLASLAQELDLGLDSFIFIDDNPLECADVRIHCPGVLTLQLPPDAGSLPPFLNHVWAFDHTGATEEDRRRTVLYRQNAQRQEFRQRSQSLGDFIRELDLRVDVTDITPADLGRASQLTFRTNQFNFTTIRRSEREIEEFLQQPGAAGLAVRVADRFGDYGLVGVVLFEAIDDRYRVDTLLLSCRVLGRGVEHAVLAQLGQRAVREGVRLVELSYRPTDRNAPAREFLLSLPGEGGNGTRTACLLRADRLQGLEYDPDDEGADGQEPPAPSEGARGRASSARGAASGFGDLDLSELLPRIAERLCDIDRITAAIEEYRRQDEPGQGPADGAPGGTLEAALLSIWRRVLGRPRIGIDDHFFEVGGTSLKAVQVIAMIKRELNREVSIVSLFESPTVAMLAGKLGSMSVESESAGASQAAQRGRKRRRALRRGVS